MLNTVIPIIAGGAGLPPTNFYSIATATVTSGGQATITFSSIPQTYTHLQLRGMNLSNTTTNGILTQFNGDTGTNYTEHDLRGSGAAVNAYAYTAQTGSGSGLTGSTTYPAVSVLDIFDYTSTNKYKTIRALYGFDSNNTAGGFVFLSSGLWLNTSAINSITLSGATFQQYSSFALYGIK